MMTVLTDHIAHACDVKRQMKQHIETMYGRLLSGGGYTLAGETATRVLTRQYGPAIQRIVEATTLDDLTARRDRLDRNLDKGYGYVHLHPGDETAWEKWNDLLTQYEVINDCLDHIKVVNGTMERIRWIDTLQRAVTTPASPEPSEMVNARLGGV